MLPLAVHGGELVARAGDISLLAEDGPSVSWDPIKVDAAEEGEAADALPSPEEAVPAPEAPDLYVWNGSAASPEAPARDVYALRLVAPRSLYDGGRIVTRTPILANLRPEPVLRVNPADAARIGAGQVRVDDDAVVRRSSRSSPTTAFLPALRATTSPPTVKVRRR